MAPLWFQIGIGIVSSLIFALGFYVIIWQAIYMYKEKYGLLKNV
jgi:hypothetical protein